MSTNSPSGHARPALEMFGQSKNSSVGTVDTRVAGGDMFSTTFNYTSNVYATASPPDAASSDARSRAQSADNSSGRQGGEVQRLLYRLLQPFWIFPRSSTTKDSDDFSLASLDEYTGSQTSAKTSGEIYVYSLLRSGNGLPCWKPRPRNPTRTGVGIIPGDVGVYTVGGGYSKIFNIWGDGPSTQHTLPPSVSCSRPSNFLTSEELTEGHALVQGVSYDTTYELDQKTLSGFQFQHIDEHQQGALLAMTSAGILEELEDHDQAAVREYICQNAGGIFKYANSIRPIGDDEALYIITGSIKSESWALAAFNHPQPHFSPRLIRQTSSFVWRSPGTFNAYSGKSVTPGSRDQTLFLRGFKVEFSLSFRSRMRSGVEETSGQNEPKDGSSTPKAPDSNECDGPSAGRTSRVQGGMQGSFSMASKSASGGAVDSEVNVISFPDNLPSCHPCDAINRFLLEKTGSDFALSHDDDWRFLLEKWASEFRQDGATKNMDGELDANIISIRNGECSVAHLAQHNTLETLEEEDAIAPMSNLAPTTDSRQNVGRTSVLGPAGDVQTFIGICLEQYLQTANKIALGERSVIIMSGKVAPASYGMEKRFICPPPTAILIGNSWWSDVAQQGQGPKLCPPSVVVSISGQSVAQESSITWSGPAGDSFDASRPPPGTTYIGRSAARNIFVSGNDHGNQYVEAVFKISSPSSSEGSQRLFGSFPCKMIRISGKPSKNVQRTRRLGLGINHGSTICLFHRLRSQTVSTKYLCVSNSCSFLRGSDGAFLTDANQQTRQAAPSFVACAHSWDPFVIYIVDTTKPGTADSDCLPSPQPGYPSIPPNAIPLGRDTDIPILYNQHVILQCMTSGVVSPVLIVRKVDRQTTVMGGYLGSVEGSHEKQYCSPGESPGYPTSQLQRVAFEIYEPTREPNDSGTPGVSGPFLSCMGEKVNTYRPVDNRKWKATSGIPLSAAPRFPVSPTTGSSVGHYLDQGNVESEPLSSSSESSIDLPLNPGRRTIKKVKSTSSIGGGAKRPGRNHHRSNSNGSVSSRRVGGIEGTHEGSHLKKKVSASSIKSSGRRRRRSSSAGSTSSRRGGRSETHSSSSWEIDVGETSIWFVVGTEQVRYDFYVPPTLDGDPTNSGCAPLPLKPVTPFPTVIRYLPPVGDVDESALLPTKSPQSSQALAKRRALIAKMLTLFGENFSKADPVQVFFGSEPSPYVEVRSSEVIRCLPPQSEPQNEKRPIILVRSDGVVFPSNVMYP